MPTGFDAFTCRPCLPAAWERMALRGVHAFGSVFDLEVERTGTAQLRVVLVAAGAPRTGRELAAGQAAEFAVA